MLDVGHNVFDFRLGSLGIRNHQLEPRTSRPEIPALEALAHRRSITIIVCPPLVLLDRPSPAHLEIKSLQRGKLFLPPLGHIHLTLQPKILGSFQRRLACLREIAVLAFTYLVHRFQDVVHHVKAVKTNLLLRLKCSDADKRASVHYRRARKTNRTPGSAPEYRVSGPRKCQPVSRCHRRPSA